MRKGQLATPEQRAKMSRANRGVWLRRKAAARIAPWEVLELSRTGTLPADRRDYVADAVGEGLAIVADLGGAEQLSAQLLALVQDAQRAGLLLRVLCARVLQSETPDLEAVAKISTLITSRRETLKTLGLERRERDVPSLASYLEDLEAKRHAPAIDAPGANGSASDPEPAPAEIVAQERSE